MICLAALLVQCQSISKYRQVASGHMVVDSSGYAYDPDDKSCDGFPKLAVETLPGTCLGMVLPRDHAVDPANDRSFIKPRTILQIPQSKNFLVVDMGGWASNNGRLFLLYPGKSGNYDLKLLKFPLNNPHGLALGPDGYFYIGEKTQISRFHINAGQVADWQLVVGNIARPEGYMHPLSQFAFDPRNGDLFINAGSPSDHCFAAGSGAYRSCPESEDQGAGVIFRLPHEKLKTLPNGGVKFLEVIAKGLRNSMAIAIHPSGFLIQGENSRDFPELEEPYEEINVIDLNHNPGYHFGWPYCYDFTATSPEFVSKQFKSPIDCTKPEATGIGEYQSPHALIPPHASPLHMAYYKGAMFSDLFGGKLLMSWHGYQPTGHRLVAYDIDAQGRPKLEKPSANSLFNFEQVNGCSKKQKFEPKGGLLRHAPYTEIISGWSQIKNLRPKGAPVAFTEADDGSLWIVEDRENRVVVRLARSAEANYQDHCDLKTDASDPLISFLAWRSQVKSNAELDAGYKQVQSEIIQKNCLGCHGNMQAADIAKDRFSTLDFLVKNDWIAPGSLEKSKIYGAIAHLEGYTPMPPIDKPQFYGTAEGQRLNEILAKWLKALPTTDVETTYSRWNLQAARNIRQKPGTDATVCGQIPAGDSVYGDQRSQTVVTTGTIKWYKIYILPSNSHLAKGACAYPEDGVFWIAN